MGKFKKIVGDFSWVDINPGNEASRLEKSNLGIMVDRHAAVQLCLGIVQLGGLLDLDKEVLLYIELDAKGREWQPVMGFVRKIMAHKRVTGIKLWQCIAIDRPA